MSEEEIRSLITGQLSLEIFFDSDGDLAVELNLGGEHICSSYVALDDIKSRVNKD